MANKSGRRRYFAGSPRKAETVTEADTNDINFKFVDLVAQRQYEQALSILDKVTDVNVLHPDYQTAALHFGAERQAEVFLDALMSARSDINYLLRDGQNMLASDIAWHHAQNEELGAKLMQKEREYAEANGLPVWTPPNQD